MIYNNEINRIKRFGDTHSMGVTRLGDHCSLNPQASLTSRRSLKRDTRWIRWSELVSFSLSSLLSSPLPLLPCSLVLLLLFYLPLFPVYHTYWHPRSELSSIWSTSGYCNRELVSFFTPLFSLPLSLSSPCFFVVFYFILKWWAVYI